MLMTIQVFAFATSEFLLNNERLMLREICQTFSGIQVFRFKET